MSSFSPDDKALKTLYGIIAVLFGFYVLQLLDHNVFKTGFFSNYLALRHDSLQSGKIWTLFTYSLLHQTSGIGHLLINLLMFFFIGRIVAPMLGAVRLVQFSAIAAVAGGMLWLATSFASGSGLVIGASGAVSAILIFFCLANWNTEMQLLLFFVLPVRLKPKFIAYFSFAVTVIGFLFFELLRPGAGGVAHSAHLGGMLAALGYYKYVYAANPYNNASTFSLSPITGLFKRNKPAKSSKQFNYKVNVSTRKPADLKNEVDRILDKISSKGFNSLTREEKQILDEAGDVLRKR